jgi:hypothetical protein
LAPVRRYLVVANQTLGGEQLLDRIRTAMAGGESEFHVVVPASHPHKGSWTDGQARVIAARRLEDALSSLRAMGASVNGEVGDASPVRAIADVLISAPLDRPFDEIILSTLPAGVSRWLHQDVVHRVERTFAVPVTHVVGSPEPVEVSTAEP